MSPLHPDFWQTPLFWCAIPVLGVLFFYSIIIVHCCSHDDLTASRRLNRFIGALLSAPNMFLFTEFSALHVMHHAFTNDLVKDPHRVRPNESWLRYCLSQYPRLVAFTFSREYRLRTWKQNWQHVDFDSPEVQRHDRVAKLFGSSGRKLHALWVLPFFSIFGGLALVTLSGYLTLGGPFLVLMLGWWLTPWAIGQILVADFNWRGHVGLPQRSEFSNADYTGQDTRSYYGPIGRLLSWLTFGFYFHREHHVRPRDCLFTKADPLVQAAQEAQFSRRGP